MVMKQLSSFMVLNVNGGDRISYTYDEVDADNGDLISMNHKESFYAVDGKLLEHVEAIREHIRQNRLV